MSFANSSRPQRPPSACPNCGGDVPPTALACPTCGADWDTGWKDLGGAGFGAEEPDEEFDYREAFDREFGSSPKPDGVKPIWWITGIAVIALFLLGALRAAL